MSKMSRPFIGRKRELEDLKALFRKNTSSLVVIRGRRRIGKSRLVEQFAKGRRFLNFSGTPPLITTSKQSQIDEFCKQFSRQTTLPKLTVDDWGDAFFLLSKEVQSGQVIILFDEISWMGSKDPEFLGKLKTAWDIYFSANPQLILVLCGSVSTWIEKNILSSAGFMGRISYRLILEELSLPECNQFWATKGAYIDPYEKLKFLSITGGVPRYLEEMDPTLSAEQNIKKLCFSKSGLLVPEFKDIFTDLFSRKSATYKKIVQTLADGPRELKEITESLEITRSGFISEYLDDLVESGFISRDFTWHLQSGEISRLSHFRLSDNYVRFYLKYIEKNLPKINKDVFIFKSLASLPAWDSIMGLQFENLVLNNRHFIMERLHINLEDVVSDNPFFQRKTTTQEGCQIDYLIETRFKQLYVCELKFLNKPVGKSIIKEVQTKIEKLVTPKGFSIRPVLIHVNGVKNEVVESGFFADIINFGDILTDDT